MAKLISCTGFKTPLSLSLDCHPWPQACEARPIRALRILAAAAKSGGLSFQLGGKRCQTCGGQGAIECSGCKGTGKNKKNGNIFERWKCFDCQGFGMKSCPTCGKGGLTPEQRGER
ncbi:SSUH2-like protein [Tasmannia lanceolata]|uniref:SSUH2-like protein n=1 Tax=Tasmannia lanceolata TaxID=3420 RepID=UPI0040640400